MAYFDGRWPVPTDFVGADLADSLYWNHAAKLGDEYTRIAPTLDLPGTVVDMEKSPVFGPSGITAILLSANTDGADDADHWASVHYPSHGTAIELPAGVGPAWFLDGLEVGKTYTFSVSAMVDIANPGSEPIPDVRLEVLDTSQASDYAALPEVVLGDEYAPYALEFVAEATTHYVALTTETAWETGAGGTTSVFRFYLAGVSLTAAPVPLIAHFTVEAPELEAEVVDGDVWEEDEPPDLPDPGGSIDEPDAPAPREIPSVIPEVTYWGLLDEDGNEITAGGYARVEIPDSSAVWEYDDESASDTLTNAVNLTGITPTGSWPVVAQVAVWGASGVPITIGPYPGGPLVPTPDAPLVVLARELHTHVPGDPVIVRTSEIMPAPTLTQVTARPIDWDASSVVTERWGRLQIVVEGEDITYLFGAPTPVPTITEVEPFGWASATIRLPQISAFHVMGSGDLSWCKQGANVRIRVRKFGGGTVDLFRGFVESPTTSEPGGVATLECVGLLFQADKQLRPPSFSTKPRDAGRVVASLLNKVVGRRYTRCTPKTTGNTTAVAGSWEPVLTGAVQQLLSTMLDKKGRQWTVMPDGREPVLRKKNLTTIAWTVRHGQRGINVDIEEDDDPNVLFGEGVAPNGGRWRNAKYPNWRPDDTPEFPMGPSEYFVVGTKDSDTTSGSGVSDWQEKVERRVTGTYSAADRQACRDIQRRAGIQVDGTVGPQTWAATFGTGSNTGSLDGAFIAPLAASPKVMPRNFGPDGDDLGENDRFNPDIVRVEDVVAFGQGVTKAEGRKAARRMMQRNGGRGWVGRVTFDLDPQEGSKLELVRAGTNGQILGYHGRALTVHVAHVSITAAGPSGIRVVATVDTKARDYPTLDAIRARERNAVDPAKAFIKRRGDSDRLTDRATFDAESPAGRLPKHALFPNLWTVVRVPFGSYGRIVRTVLTTTDSASKFSVAVFSKPVTAAKIKALVGNPLTAEENPWSEKADELEDLGLLQAWGWAKQPAGYYPGSFHTPDGETEAPITGRLVDDSAWEYASEKSPWVWVASIASSGCHIKGRFFHGVN